MNDGGNAFPNVITGWNQDEMQREVTSEGGMTLRDYFAAKAMQSFVIGTTGLGTLDSYEVKRQFALVSDYAYLMADAMLKTREA